MSPKTGIWLALWFSILCSLTLSGCSVGPKVITQNRTRYNDAIRITTQEEMLLNLVRVKYEDPPEFLGIDGITTQFEVGSSLTAGGGEIRVGDAAQNRFRAFFFPEANIGAVDIPTISFSPLHGEEFVRRFLSPISVETILLLMSGGENVERVLRLVVQCVNGIENSPEDFEMGKGQDPGTFLFVANLLGELAKQRQIEFAYEEKVKVLSHPIATDLVTGRDVAFAADKGFKFQLATDGKSVILTDKERKPVLRAAVDMLLWPAWNELLNVLKLEEGPSYPIKLAIEGQLQPLPPPGARNEILVSTRSVERILHFLSDGISVPAEHVAMGLVPTCSGSMAESLLRVEVCKKRPRQAAVAVHYRGYWFYINDADLHSKQTFDLLLDLFNLEIRAGGARQVPVLTLGVGRR